MGPKQHATPRVARGPGGAAGELGRVRTLADAVLHLIWVEQRISRAEIARRTNLSRSTVSDIVASLLTTRLVAEAGAGASRGGRRPIELEFQDDAYTILGVDIGASHISVILTDLGGRQLAWRSAEYPVQSDRAGTLALVAEYCEACLIEYGGPRKQLLGIGMAVPSPVDPLTPERISTLALPAWHGRSGAAELRARFGVPVLVDNDANLGTLGEHWWGAGRGIDDFTYIKMATGIGSGHLLGGKIYRGAHGVAGEMGHLAIDPRGEQCVCGNRGCLVTLVGTQALEALATKLLPEYPTSVLQQSSPVTIGDIEAAALIDDPLAMQVVGTAAAHLGIAVAGLLNLLNPAAVIFGGGFARLGERLTGPVRETAMARTFVSSMAAEIRTSELGERDVAIGAATQVLDAALTDPTLFPTIGARP